MFIRQHPLRLEENYSASHRDWPLKEMHKGSTCKVRVSTIIHLVGDVVEWVAGGNVGRVVGSNLTLAT